MKYNKYAFMNLTGLVLILLALILTAACGAQVVRGASPLVRMNELSHQDNSITLQLSMRNVNGVDLDIQSIDFSLSIDDQELFTYNGPVDTNIVANGTETWTVDVEENQTSRELLNSLQNGDVNSLPYSLNGAVMTTQDKTLRFEHEGHLYPLPGRPGHFR
jgi:outer membrane lipoprotein-sorting protein